MNHDPDFVDTPAYPQGVGEFIDAHYPDPPRTVEWWGNAKTGFSEPTVIIYNRRGYLDEVNHVPLKSPNRMVGWLAVALFLISVALMVAWGVMQ